MNALLFVGPTLSPAGHERLGDFRCLPPVAQGDLYKAATSKPRAIGIIDGYVHGVPSVWHKEVLWAMSQGIHVFGAASMGALRAAELHEFGMRGVGKIFEGYRDGALTDDDEVAVLHGPAKVGYLTMTEPMVNIRATLSQAVDAGILTSAESALIEALAKRQFYETRTWETVFEAAGEAAVSPQCLSALRDWLPQGYVDQKRADALAMIEAMARLLDTQPEPLNVSYHFEVTEMWASAPWLGQDSGHWRGAEDDRAERILDELRLDIDVYWRTVQQALLRALASGHIEPGVNDVDRGAVTSESDAFRLSRGLIRRQDVEQWSEDNAMDMHSFAWVMSEEAQVRALARANASLLGDRMLRQLSLSGDYRRLAERAERKARLMAEGTSSATAVLERRPLVEWYFSERLCRDVPNNIRQHAADIGLEGEEEFHEILRREYLYLKTSNDDDSPR